MTTDDLAPFTSADSEDEAMRVAGQLRRDGYRTSVWEDGMGHWWVLGSGAEPEPAWKLALDEGDRLVICAAYAGPDRRRRSR